MSEAQYRIEDVTKAPRGWQVRTRLQGPHRLRIAFPPGRREKGAGQLVQILHPRTENPKGCKVKAGSQKSEIGSRNGKRRNRNVPLGEAALTVLLNKGKRRGKSKNNGNGAAKDYSDFHGRKPREVLEMQDALAAAGDYSSEGKMGELWLYPVHVEGDEDAKVVDDNGKTAPPSIVFDPEDEVLLVRGENGRQLYLMGGNQKLPLDYAEKRGLPIDKRWISLGSVYAISYETEKSLNDYQTSTYVHELGEVTGERPLLVYDTETERMFFVGGAYSVAPFDRELGASPGIVN